MAFELGIASRLRRNKRSTSGFLAARSLRGQSSANTAYKWLKTIEIKEDSKIDYKNRYYTLNDPYLSTEYSKT
eukprot:5066617-Pleurochrysis_carterae.AAC.1